MIDRADLEYYLSLLEYEQALREAEDDLVRFAEMTMPNIRRMDDFTDTLYMAAQHHRLMADVMMRVERGEKRKVILNTAPRHGKACADDTPVLTPRGWVQHGDLKAGDTVFGPDGRPTEVLATHRWEPDMMEVEISNGEVINVHRNHEWTVIDAKSNQSPEKTLETNELAREVWLGERGRRGSRARWRLPLTSAIEMPEAVLPAHPYALGAWLGDGAKDAARVVGVDDEVFEAMTACGYSASATGVHSGTGVRWANYSSGRPNVRSQLSAELYDMGLVGKKRIPERYLRASVRQRLDLLAGLMDTDGHVDAKGRCRIVTAEADLADDIFDLCASLGFRPYRSAQEAHTSTSGIIGRRATITIGFQPTMEIPCRVPRKKPTRLARQRRLSIVDIRTSSASGCQSIQVSREDGLYLVGRTLVPTHNTELCTKRFAAWYSARHPEKDIMVTTYNEKFAQDFAKDVRDIVASPRFQQIFPDYYLTQASNEQMRTYAGGNLFFLGRRSSTTGRGGDLIIVDDPTKDDKEVRYSTFRDDVWQWFTQTLLTRRHNDRAAIVVTQTRWHEDDIVGRITDKNNPAYSEKFARGFEVINLPAIATEDDPMGRKPGSPLWPERFGLEYLEEMQAANPLSFAALYQCDPTPEDGVYYRTEDLYEYDPGELPDNLRMFAVSDHAVSTKDHNDPSCLVPFGIDESGTAWVMPNIAWRRMDASETVEEMLSMIEHYKPIFWYAEKGHISRAIGPFLRKRMQETGIYCPIVEEHPIGDKLQRAHSGRARCAQGKIKFPRNAPWWPKAKSELLKFPNGRFDDFVDVVSMIGLKLTTHTSPGKTTYVPKEKPGTFGHLLKQFREDDIRKRAERDRAGW